MCPGGWSADLLPTSHSCNAACRGGSLSLSGVDTVSLAACTFTNSSVTEWPNSPDSGGQCLTAFRLGYTAGDAMFAEKFSLATFTGTRSVSRPVHGVHVHVTSDMG